MNCKEKDVAMVVRRGRYVCPHCGSVGPLDLVGRVVRVTSLRTLYPWPVWNLEAYIPHVTVVTDKGCILELRNIDTLPDWMLQPLPGLDAGEEQATESSLPQAPERRP